MIFWKVLLHNVQGRVEFTSTLSNELYQMNYIKSNEAFNSNLFQHLDTVKTLSPHNVTMPWRQILGNSSVVAAECDMQASSYAFYSFQQ